jgi:hypothetical protein
MLTKKIHLLGFIVLGLVLVTVPNTYAGQEQQKSSSKPMNKNSKINCQKIDIRCAKTVTSAFAPNGDLWRLWSQSQGLYYQVSADNGVKFSVAKRVPIANEKISARNENRPKIAFDNNQGIYLSWAMSQEKKYTADIRFSYSRDYGKFFSPAITVNDDNLLTGHSFNEMAVNEYGEVSIVWLDGRLKQSKKSSQGSAIFMATANIKNPQTDFGDQVSVKQDLVNQRFVNKEVVNGTCVCCRLAIDYNNKGNLAILWRHIYGDNIREFALMTLNEHKAPYQVSYDHWKINGCPHQGGALSIDDNNRYHLVWFNQGDKGKGIFYAYSDNAGETLTTPLAIGEQAAQAAHPHMNEQNGIVDIVWLQFTGKEHQLWHQRSTDKGKRFSAAKIIAKAQNGADRPFIVHKKSKSYVSWQRFQQGHWLSQL